MASTTLRGLTAGAAGFAALTLTGYVDMALRGRPASPAPGQTVAALARRLGTDVPGTAEQRANRLAALGELTGAAVALATSAAVARLRTAGLRLGPVTGGVATGAAAMALADTTMARLGASDPRRWSGADWAIDAVTHLVYGVTTHATLTALERSDRSTVQRGDLTTPTRSDLISPEPGDLPTAASSGAPAAATGQRAPAGARLLARSAVLGLAAGGRSSLGVAAPTLTGRSPRRASVGAAVLAVAGELVADKLPRTPSRVDPKVLPARLVSGATGGLTLARRDGAAWVLPAVVGAGGALAGSFGGYTWRQRAAGRLPDWQAALIEDVAAMGLAAAAARPRRAEA